MGRSSRPPHPSTPLPLTLPYPPTCSPPTIQIPGDATVVITSVSTVLIYRLTLRVRGAAGAAEHGDLFVEHLDVRVLGDVAQVRT